MAKSQGRRISGIFVPIELDTSRMQESIKKVNTQLSGLATTIISSLDRNLNIAPTVRSFDSLYRSIGNAKNAAKALSTVKSGDFFKDLGSSEAELKELAKTFGITTEAQKEFLEQIYKTQAINQEVNSVRSLSRSLGMATEEFIDFAKARGLAFSGDALQKLVPDKALQQIEKLSKEYKELIALSGQTSTSLGLQKFIDSGRIKEAVDATLKLNNGQRVTVTQMREIASATNTTTQQVRNYVKEIEKANRIGRNLFVSAFTPSNIVAGLQSGASAVGVVGGMYGAVELTKSAYQASMRLENLNLAFKSIYNSAEVAGQKMQFVKETADELGLSFLSTAEGAKRVFASAQGTVLEDEAENIVKAFSTMGAALKLTGSEMDSVFLAISQMLSKGKVSAEELRLQLSERMPGAVTLFARSIDTSTAELDAMLQKGQVGLAEFAKFTALVQQTYAEGAKDAASGLQAELNRLSTAWMELKTSFVDTEGSADILRSLTDGLKTLTSFSPEISQLASIMLEVAKAAAIMYAGAKIGSVVRWVSEIVSLNNELSKSVGRIGAVSLQVDDLASKIFGATSAFNVWSAAIAGGAFIAYSIYEWAEGFNGVRDSIQNAEKEVNKLIARIADLKDIDVVNKELNALSLKLKKLAETGVRFTLEKQEDFFTPWKQDAVISSAESTAKTFYTSFSKALEAGNLEEAASAIQKFKEESNRLLADIKPAEGVEGQSEKFIKAYEENTEAILEYANGIMLAKEQADKLANSTIKLGESKINLDTSEAFTMLKEIQSIAGETQLAKELKDNLNLDIVVSSFVKLGNSANQSKEILEQYAKSVELAKIVGNEGIKLDINTEQIKAAEGIIKGFDQGLQLVVGYLRDNGITIDSFAEKLTLVAREAGWSDEKIQELIGSIYLLNQEASKTNLSDFVEGLRIDLLESDFTTPVQKIAEQLQKQGALNDYAELLYIVNTGQYKLLRGLQLTTEAQDIFNKTVALGNKKSGSSKKSDFEKLFESLTSFNERYTEKSMTDIEKAANDFKAVYADVDKFLASGKGTDTQRQKLLELVSTLKMTEQAYIDQLRAKEAQEKAETRAEEFRRFNAEFAEVMGSERDARLANIDEWYDEERARWQSLLIGKIVDAEEYNEKLTQLEQMYNMKRMEESTAINDQMKLTLKSWFDEYENTAPQIADFTVDAFRTAADAIGDFAASGLRDIDSLGDAFSNMADQMLQTAARMFSNQMFSSMFQWIGGETSIGSWFGGLFSAKGNVFSNSPDLHKFSNSVISKPTLFNYGTHVKAYAKGAGLMGEAGPEAVVPLVRTSSGHLGVRTVGNNGGTNVYVNVINKSDAQVTTRESQDNQGNTNIEFLIEKHVGNAMKRPGSDPYRALNNTYGANMRLANR